MLMLRSAKWGREGVGAEQGPGAPSMRYGAGLRRRELSLAAMALVGSVDAEDAVIDFSSAGLYVAGIQTVFAVVSVAVVSVLACWIAPENGVSAVRTLALCSATGAALMRAPLRIGRTHGVNVVFSSLQPAIVLYLMALVVEQLIHTCSIETQTAPSWRKVVFHAMTIVMTAAGVMRARAPMSDTDLPFLATASALLVIAVLPPQSVALVGPLCQQVGGWAAAERCLRALVFSALYSVHVYSSIAASSLTRTESLVVIARSAAAAVWTMASHVALLVVAVLQCTVVLTARIRIATTAANGATSYRPIPDQSVLSNSDDDADASTTEDLERGATSLLVGARACARTRLPPPPPLEEDPVAHQRALLSATSVASTLLPRLPDRRASPTEEHAPSSPTRMAPEGSFGPLKFRELGGPAESPPPPPPPLSSHLPPLPPPLSSGNGGGGLRAADMTAERMRSIVSAIESGASVP